MAINFPDTPQVGETHTESGRQWEWNGTSWRIIGNASNYTLPIASDVTLGGIKVGSNLTINALTGVLDAPPPSGYTLPVATTTQLGGVKIDGNTIVIDGNGVISGQAAYTLPVATTNVLGGVKIDGTSITINNGVISAAATGGANVTTDDTPPTIASDGDLWWDSVAGNLKVYYEDVDSSQWVDASANGGGSGGAGAGGRNIPVGGVIMWSGSVANIPTGWALCDGTNGTPDLRNNFVIGAGQDGGIWYSDYLDGNYVVGQGHPKDIFDNDLTTFALPDPALSFTPNVYSGANSVTSLRVYCTKYLNANTGIVLFEVDGIDYTASVSGAQRTWVTIPVTSFTNITWKKSGNPGDSFQTSDYCLVFAIEVNGTVLTNPAYFAPGDQGGSSQSFPIHHKHTTTIDDSLVHPATGQQAFANGGAGTYYGTLFEMDHEGVDGTDRNMPPYYALCYIMCTN